MRVEPVMPEFIKFVAVVYPAKGKHACCNFLQVAKLLQEAYQRPSSTNQRYKFSL
jgi:hypothetical protein